MKPDADAAAHDDTVDEGDDRLGIALEPPVQTVFVLPESAGSGVLAGLHLIMQQANVAAGTERLFARAFQDDPRDALIGFPGVQRSVDAPHHAMGQRVGLARPVESQDTGRARARRKKLRFGVCGHGVGHSVGHGVREVAGPKRPVNRRPRRD
jgi:hypothetical protein